MKHRDLNVAKPCDQCGLPFYRDKRCTWAHWHRARFCSRSCTAAYNLDQPSKRLSEREEFARWFVETEGCWEWKGAKDRDGYGIFSGTGKAQRANRTALKLDGRPPKKGEYACHHCDNPSCVRPSHLYAGTPLQNSSDAIVRDRLQRGSRHYGAKLNEDDIRAIRRSSESGPALANRYGVTPSNIIAIRNMKTWRHV